MRDHNRLVLREALDVPGVNRKILKAFDRALRVPQVYSFFSTAVAMRLKTSSNISSGILLQVAPPSNKVTHGLFAMWMSDWLLKPGIGADFSFTVS
jgi:hypothetical protein